MGYLLVKKRKGRDFTLFFALNARNNRSGRLSSGLAKRPRPKPGTVSYKIHNILIYL
ncbi:MAG: hypothetical protein K2Y16_02880 [Burkholderiales bacterium]|nr:hypothetical protein [Burkholderiales bacterium]